MRSLPAHWGLAELKCGCVCSHPKGVLAKTHQQHTKKQNHPPKSAATVIKARYTNKIPLYCFHSTTSEILYYALLCCLGWIAVTLSLAALFSVRSDKLRTKRNRRPPSMRCSQVKHVTSKERRS